MAGCVCHRLTAVFECWRLRLFPPPLGSTTLPCNEWVAKVHVSEWIDSNRPQRYPILSVSCVRLCTLCDHPRRTASPEKPQDQRLQTITRSRRAEDLAAYLASPNDHLWRLLVHRSFRHGGSHSAVLALVSTTSIKYRTHKPHPLSMVDLHGPTKPPALAQV